MLQNIKWTVFEKLTPVRPVLKPSLHSLVPPECSAELVVVHLRFTLPRPPQAGHLVWVLDDKLSVVSLPGDDIMVLLFPEQLQNEVPQLDLPGARARLWLVGPLWEGKPWGERERRSDGWSWQGKVLCLSHVIGDLHVINYDPSEAFNCRLDWTAAILLPGSTSQQL